MVTLQWCKKQKHGIELVLPNANISSSYMSMAQESIGQLEHVADSNLWTATMSYYIFYYSLYALMIRMGIKCEIHSCSLEVMEQLLTDIYNKKDVEMINKTCSARIDLQYYSDRPVDQEVIDVCRAYCKTFFIKTKDALAHITEDQIASVRNTIKEI